MQPNRRQPQRKRCQYGCGLIRANEYADHIYCHEAQTTLVDVSQYEVKTESKSRGRNNQNGGLA